MRRGQRSGKTHAQLDLKAHLEIRDKPDPRDGKPRVPPVNDALQRLQLSPSDERWTMQPPYGWVTVEPGALIPGPCSGERCWYCAERVTFALPFRFSKKLRMVAHPECALGEK